MPADDHGLLARLDALTDLVARRRGLALQPDGRLAPAELHAVAGACALRPATRPRGAAAGTSGLDAAELLRTIAEAVGLLRTRGLRLEATAPPPTRRSATSTSPSTRTRARPGGAPSDTGARALSDVRTRPALPSSTFG